MSASVVIDPSIQVHRTGWKWFLLQLCALFSIWLGAVAIDNLGIGGKTPWYGWWDATLLQSGEPYVLTAKDVVPGGATAQARIRTGDRFDARDQTLNGRMVLFTQPSTVQPSKLVVHRGATTFTTSIVGTTIWQVEPSWKIAVVLAQLIPGAWFLGCALLIALRRWWLFDGRYLALILLFLVPAFFNNAMIVGPDPWVGLLTLALLQACALVALSLLVGFSTHFGVESRLRRAVEIVAYAAIGLDVIVHGLFYYGVLTERVDPLAFNYTSNAVGPYDAAVCVPVVLLCALAVSNTAPSGRPRAAWLLLPLPVALLASAVMYILSAFSDSWFVEQVLQIASAAFVLLGACSVTYAVLKRRVLDFEFVIGRTVVVALVSIIVVAAFVLLEWLLGPVIAGVSHTTGLVANAVIALVLGLSLRFIHRRVDAFVDTVLFRKRHADERALLDFSNEATYITETDALLDRTIDAVRAHTDARSAALLLNASPAYITARSFGHNDPIEVSENDGAILALKTWHKPLDPHLYSTGLKGALLLPMLARGELVGVLVLGERAGGEAYAPDEVDALSQLARGVGTTLHALSMRNEGSIAALQESMNKMSEIVAAINDRLEALSVEITENQRNASYR